MALLVGQQAIADYCGVTRWTVNDWIKNKAFPATKVGKHYLVTTDLIKLWHKAIKSAQIKNSLKARAVRPYQPPEVVVKVKTSRRSSPKPTNVARVVKTRQETRKIKSKRWKPIEHSSPDQRVLHNPRELKLRRSLLLSQADPSDES